MKKTIIGEQELPLSFDLSDKSISKNEINEFHLFAGIGGGIYGGELLGHKCCGGVEIDDFCQSVLQQRQKDGWMNKFDIYGDICSLNGKKFKGKFDILCGGFPCQAFSTAAHGKNIGEKNLWQEMFRFVQESDAPVVFGENVVLKAIEKARKDLESIGYKVERCRLSCSDLGADHQRNRFWFIAVKDNSILEKVYNHLSTLKKFSGNYWSNSPQDNGDFVEINNRRAQLKGVGNAQSPFVAATAFRVLVNRHLSNFNNKRVEVSTEELSEVFIKTSTWIQEKYGDIGLLHTPTTMANYAAPSMMKHQGCRNFTKVFGHPDPENAEYLMGFPLGASSSLPQKCRNIDIWKNKSIK